MATIYLSDNPCKKDCPDRSATCHSKCKKYLEWKDNTISVDTHNWVDIAHADRYKKTMHRKAKRKE